MKIIHFSDTHLGINIENTSRENDFYDNFKKVIDDIIFFRPDFVVHSGDLFHYSKPGNKALSIAIEWFLKLSNAGIKTIIIAWNHSTPRLISTTHPFSILEKIPNLYTFYEQKLDNIEFENINFVCLPHIYNEELFREELWNSSELKKEWKLNILISHFWLQSKEYDEYTDEISGVNILIQDLEKIKSFDYIALGHYHKNFCIGKNIYYSWSIEKTSFNQKDYKIWYNIVSFEPELKVEFAPLETRKMIDLWKINCENIYCMDDLILNIENNIDLGNIQNSITKIFLYNIKNKLALEFDDNKLSKLFKNTFYFEYKKDFYREDRNKNEKYDIDISQDDFIKNIFDDFIADYQINDENIDKDKLKSELKEMFNNKN